MVERYENKEIKKIFSDEHKLWLWQETELAVIKAMLKAGLIAQDEFDAIDHILRKTPIDINWWLERDAAIHHDLNAFLDERLQHLPKKLHQHFHKNITSYDTEEPAFARSLSEAAKVLEPLIISLEKTLEALAIKYRYTIMIGRTHGQEAELQTFGAKCLTWLADFRAARKMYAYSLKVLQYSKLSGAIGKYGGLDPEIEKEALGILGFIPFYGATQIMPRILYAPIAQSLSNMVSLMDKIGHDIRLAARSGRPILQEPFKSKQKGSSAMPQKKNTIRTEQLEGMARAAKGYMIMITDNIKTWEERAIEQSCVERIAWPDIFSVAAQSLKVLDGVLSRLTVYPDNMLQEIYESRGVYASSEVKEFLKEHLSESGLTYEDIYRIVQLACFNVFEPRREIVDIRDTVPSSFEEAKKLLNEIGEIKRKRDDIISIQDFIPFAFLRTSKLLDITEEQVESYSDALQKLFAKDGIRKKWNDIFDLKFLLRHQDRLYQEIIEK